MVSLPVGHKLIIKVIVTSLRKLQYLTKSKGGLKKIAPRLRLEEKHIPSRFFSEAGEKTSRHYCVATRVRR